MIYFHNYFQKEICVLLNETVSHEDQARALGVSLKFYQKMVRSRKVNEETAAGRLLAVVREFSAFFLL